MGPRLKNFTRRDFHICLALLAVAALVRFPRLGAPPVEYFDEVYHAKTALEYLEGRSPTEWVHPPTAKLLIAVGVWVFGFVPWAWRLAPAIAGTLLAPVFFLLARTALRTERAALLAVVLLLLDGVYLVQSRIAMTNIFAVLFQVSTVFFVLRAALRERLPALGMTLAGLALGLALSTRWTSLFAAAFAGLVLIALRRERLLRMREIALTLLAFGVIPVMIYVLSYVPWFLQGHSLRELWPLQKAIWTYHATLDAEHPYFSSWYTWPLLVRPTWYHWLQEGGSVEGIVALGNPLLWWASVPLTIWALKTGVRQRDPALLFSGLGFCWLYLPWGISPRTLNYSHYLFEAIPYACLSAGIALDRLWNTPSGLVAKAFVALCALWLVYFFPLLTAIPLPEEWFFSGVGGLRPWTWFSTWT